ncbi:MAG: DUF3488 domain-containing protein [Pirellulales bacterium]|nr:DUF3488 domain-containing protein [Pirellulales bacterium]
MAIAHVAVEVSSNPAGLLSWFGVSFGICLFATAMLVSRYVPFSANQPHLPRWATLVLALLLIAPLGLEPLLRRVTGNGQPLELQMVSGVRVLGVGLAALARWAPCLQLAGVVSLFLLLFVVAMGAQTPIPWLLAAYTVVGSLWLMLAYSSRVRFTAASETTPGMATAVERVRLRFPAWEMTILVLLTVAALCLTVIGPKRVTIALAEMMPTSGGTGKTDPFARYGIGDGPEEVAGDNARAAGMVETDMMIEDNKNALLDAINDMYGPPHRPPQKLQRMVAGGIAEIIKMHGKLPQSARPSRDFDTSRKGPKSDKKLDSHKARGVIEVEGRTPLHVRLVAYESYDPDTASWIEGHKPASRLIEAEGGDWMRLMQPKASVGWYAKDERHRLKVADLKTNLVPTPTLLTRFRIQRVDRPDYYEWNYDGVLALAGRTSTPPGVVVSTECRTLDPSRLPASAIAAVGTSGDSALLLDEVPDALHRQIAQIARNWAGDRPRGWPQIEAVLNTLRSEYTLDRAATAPPDHPAPVVWFLVESRRGPDYLFATAAALLLRALDYPTRVCLGYYAAPEAYDPKTAHTPVRTTDLHTWPEVLLCDRQWLVIEPTPGYEVLGPRLPWSERAWLAVQWLGLWAWRHSVALTIAVLAAVVITWKRHGILDWLLVWLWRLFPGRSWREVVLGCLWILERRHRRQRRCRPSHQTLAAWVASLNGGASEDRELAELVWLGEWAAYGPDLPTSLAPAEIRTHCQRVLQTWTLSRLNQPTRRGRVA